jgi:hypothetical protein
MITSAGIVTSWVGAELVVSLGYKNRGVSIVLIEGVLKANGVIGGWPGKLGKERDTCE